jgi:hypothetical protein
MLDRYLTPLEKFDFAQSSKGLERWVEIWYWIFVVAIAVRMFISLDDIWWFRIGQWSVTLGGWIAFFLPPGIVYKIISRRVSDGTLQAELLMPIPTGQFLWGKLKVVLMVVVGWTGPFFLMGLLSDPNLSFGRAYIARSLLLPYDPGMNLLALFIVIFLYFTVWVTMVLFVGRLALTGRIHLEIIGAYAFWLLVAMLAFAWVKSRLEIYGQESIEVGNWVALALVTFPVFIAIAALLVKSSMFRIRLIA